MMDRRLSLNRPYSAIAPLRAITASRLANKCPRRISAIRLPSRASPLHVREWRYPTSLLKNSTKNAAIAAAGSMRHTFAEAQYCAPLR
jgi:hypothetical protein